MTKMLTTVVVAAVLSAAIVVSVCSGSNSEANAQHGSNTIWRVSYAGG